MIKYAIASGKSELRSSGLLASIFASIYLGSEMSLKVLGSVAARYGFLSTNGLFAVYGVFAIATTCAMSFIWDLMPVVNEERTSGRAKVQAALLLLLTNPKCALLFPTCVSFGFTSAFVVSYIQGSVVAPISDLNVDDNATSADQHTSQVLLYSSVAVGVATILSLPGFGFHYLRSVVGTQLVMFLGAFSFATVASLCLILGTQSLRRILLLLYIVYGVGRSVWESTVKVQVTRHFNLFPNIVYDHKMFRPCLQTFFLKKIRKLHSQT